jgi:hypothetical protein
MEPITGFPDHTGYAASSSASERGRANGTLFPVEEYTPPTGVITISSFEENHLLGAERYEASLEVGRGVSTRVNFSFNAGGEITYPPVVVAEYVAGPTTVAFWTR